MVDTQRVMLGEGPRSGSHTESGGKIRCISLSACDADYGSLGLQPLPQS